VGDGISCANRGELQGVVVANQESEKLDKFTAGSGFHLYAGFYLYAESQERYALIGHFKQNLEIDQQSHKILTLTIL
jgi:hypothetical protein